MWAPMWAPAGCGEVSLLVKGAPQNQKGQSEESGGAPSYGAGPARCALLRRRSERPFARWPISASGSEARWRRREAPRGGSSCRSEGRGQASQWARRLPAVGATAPMAFRSTSGGADLQLTPWGRRRGSSCGGRLHAINPPTAGRRKVLSARSVRQRNPVAA